METINFPNPAKYDLKNISGYYHRFKEKLTKESKEQEAVRKDYIKERRTIR